MRVAHNIVDVVKRVNGLDIQGSFDYVEGMYKSICTGLLDDFKNLPSFESPFDEVVKAYAEGLIEWVQGNIEFSLASGRYFGEFAGNSEIRETGLVAIFPPKDCTRDVSLWGWVQRYVAHLGRSVLERLGVVVPFLGSIFIFGILWMFNV